MFLNTQNLFGTFQSVPQKYYQKSSQKVCRICSITIHNVSNKMSKCSKKSFALFKCQHQQNFPGYVPEHSRTVLKTFQSVPQKQLSKKFSKNVRQTLQIIYKGNKLQICSRTVHSIMKKRCQNVPKTFCAFKVLHAIHSVEAQYKNKYEMRNTNCRIASHMKVLSNGIVELPRF